LMQLLDLVDAQWRRHTDWDCHFSWRDLSVLLECTAFFVAAEVYCAVLLPLLGLVSNEPSSAADLLTRGRMFLAAPLGYLFLWLFVAGGIHAAYHLVWPEHGVNTLSIQGVPMTTREVRKAASVCLKSIACISFVSSYTFYAFRGETNVYAGNLRWTEPFAVVAAYVLIDIAAYAIHRGLHHPILYRTCHKVHHMWKAPTTMITSALAPFEILALTSSTQMVCVALPMHVFSYVFIMLFIYFFNCVDHSGLHLQGKFFCRLFQWQAHPLFHDHHHQYFHTNYGAMVDWWDKLGGTFYDPRKHGKLDLGEESFVPVHEQIRARKRGESSTSAETS